MKAILFYLAPLLGMVSFSIILDGKVEYVFISSKEKTSKAPKMMFPINGVNLIAFGNDDGIILPVNVAPRKNLSAISNPAEMEFEALISVDL